MNDYERIRDILDKSSYTVAMCGTDMMKESGMPSLRAPEIAYQVEKEFGYSPEEIFSSVFYANRPDTFFKYYREWMLKPHLEPSAGFYALAELEKLPLEQLIDHSFGSIFPNMDAKWLRIYERTALYGETLEITDYSSEIDTELKIVCFPTFPGHCGCMLFDRRRIQTAQSSTSEDNLTKP